MELTETKAERLTPLQKVGIASIAVLAGVTALVGCSDETTSSNPTTASTAPGETEQATGAEAEQPSLEQLFEDVKAIEFMATPDEWTALLETNSEQRATSATNFLQNKNIELAYDIQHPTEWGLPKAGEFALEVGLMPCAAVRYVGLTKITVVDIDPDSLNQPAPTYHNGEITVRGEWQVADAIAAMTIDSLAPEARNQLMDDFVNLSQAAGKNYDPNYQPLYNDANQSDYDNSAFKQNNWDEIFETQESMHDPRSEFIHMYANLLNGFGHRYESDPQSVIAQKYAIVESIFAGIVPNGEALLRFNDYTSYFGTHGLHPYDNTDRLAILIPQFNAASTEAEKDEIIQKDYNLEQNEIHRSPDLTISPKETPTKDCATTSVQTPEDGDQSEIQIFL